jgi:HAD superfamily hydrolase (TIGR01549 family)
MPAALLLDLDDTLIDDRGAMATAVLRFRKSHSLAIHEDDAIVAERWDTIGRSLWRRLALGEVSFAEQRRMRLRETFSIALTDDEADSLFSEYLKDYEQCWSLLPGAKEFLAATAHLPRVIVTNGHRPQAHKKISMLGLAQHFKAVVTPDDCGARKPDPRIFQYALQLLGVKAADALMVGDNHESDIAPALALGMQAFHISSTVVGRSIRDAAGAA